MTTIFIVEAWFGYKCGGTCDVAFTERQAAERWVLAQRTKDEADLLTVVDFYKVKEVELK